MNFKVHVIEAEKITVGSATNKLPLQEWHEMLHNPEQPQTIAIFSPGSGAGILKVAPSCGCQVFDRGALASFSETDWQSARAAKRGSCFWGLGN